LVHFLYIVIGWALAYPVTYTCTHLHVFVAAVLPPDPSKLCSPHQEGIILLLPNFPKLMSSAAPGPVGCDTSPWNQRMLPCSSTARHWGNRL